MEEKKKKKYGVHLWAVIFWIAVWQIASSAVDQNLLVVSPLKTLQTLLSLMGTADFWKSISISMLHVLAGFAAAMVLGTMLAWAASIHPRLKQLAAPVLYVIKAAPVVSFIILVLFYAPGNSVSVIISFLMVFPIVYENILTGISDCDQKLLEMADIFEIDRKERIRTIYCSQVLPYFENACSLGLGLGWKAGIAAEVIGMSDGSIGDKLYHAKVFLDTPSLFAWTIAIILLSVLFQKGFSSLLHVLINHLEREE